MFTNGRNYLAIPGPSVTPEAVLQAMHRTSTDIYGTELPAMAETIYPDLKALARTTAHVGIYIGNGHAAWEAAMANTIDRGERVLVLVTGGFGSGWAAQARALGIEAVELNFGLQSAVDPQRVEEALRADLAAGGAPFKGVFVSHVDTATSVRNEIAPIREAITAAGHPALLYVDCIASLGCDRFEMDAWGVDVMVATSQKGLMVPPGISFVYFNEHALALRHKMKIVSAYWDWLPRLDPPAFYALFGGTPPVQHLYGLRAALDILKAEGLENVWKRHEALASALWAAFDVWGQGGPLKLNLQDRALRSHAVTAAFAGQGNGLKLREWTSSNMGVTLGVPIGFESSSHFRVGHMGHVNGHMMMGVISTIEAGLQALQVPHGTGAVEAAAAVLAAASR